MADSAQDRKLPATQRKIDKARREGQIARSRDLGHLGALGAGVALVAFFAPDAATWLKQLLADALRFDVVQVSQPEAMVERLAASSERAGAVLLPLFAAEVVVALLGGLLAGGWNLTLEPIKPKFNKLNPLTGLRRVFVGPQLVDTLKACLLATTLGATAALYLSRQWMHHAELLALPLPAALAAGGELLLGGLLLLLGVLAVFALVDVPLQRQLLQRRLRMTVEEVKKEMKEVEGNAEVKGKMKLRMREMVGRRVYQVRDAMAAGRPLPGRAPLPRAPEDMDPLHRAPAGEGVAAGAEQ